MSLLHTLDLFDHYRSFSLFSSFLDPIVLALAIPQLAKSMSSMIVRSVKIKSTVQCMVKERNALGVGICTYSMRLVTCRATWYSIRCLLVENHVATEKSKIAGSRQCVLRCAQAAHSVILTRQLEGCNQRGRRDIRKRFICHVSQSVLVLSVAYDPAQPAERPSMHLFTMQEFPLRQLLFWHLALQQVVHFSRCPRPQHRHKSIKLHIPWYQRHEISEKHVDGIVKVVQGRHQHQHRPEAKYCNERTVVPLLELEDAGEVSRRSVEIGRSGLPKAIRSPNCVLQDPFRQRVVEVVESQTEQSHDSFAICVWHIFKQLLLRRSSSGINTARNVV